MGTAVRRLARALGIALAALIAALIVGESALRVFDPETSYSPPTIRIGSEVRPLGDIVQVLTEAQGALGPRGANLECRVCYDRPRRDDFDAQGCVPVRTNSLGLRDAEILPEKPAGELRVLALGDSFTFGLGVPGDAAWPEVLERLLAGERGGTPRVVNGGFAGGGFRPSGYLPWLESTGLTLEPDAIVLGFCLNDIHPRVPMAILSPPVVRPWLGGVSTLLNRVQRALHVRTHERELARLGPEVARRAMQRFLVEDGEWAKTQAALSEMERLLGERGIPFLVAVFPMFSRLARDYPYATLHEAVTSYCAQEQIPCLDLGPTFVALAERGVEDADFWVHPTDQHPASPAHGRIAAEILQALKPLLAQRP